MPAASLKLFHYSYVYNFTHWPLAVKYCKNLQESPQTNQHDLYLADMPNRGALQKGNSNHHLLNMKMCGMFYRKNFADNISFSHENSERWDIFSMHEVGA